MQITNPPDEVTDDATHSFCAAVSSGFPGLYRQVSAPQAAGRGASVGSLSTICPSSAAPPERSLVLGLDISALVWLAGSAGLRPASHGHLLAKEAIPGPPEPVEQERVEKSRVPLQKPPPSPGWKTFLRNHVRDLVSLDFFVVATVKHKVLFVLLILAHARSGSSIST